MTLTEDLVTLSGPPYLVNEKWILDSVEQYDLLDFIPYCF